MISKQDFLGMVKNQIFPTLSRFQKELKWLKMLSFKRLILFLFLSSGISGGISIAIGIILNDFLYGVIFEFFAIFIIILILVYVIRFVNKINNKISTVITPKIFSALNLVGRHPTDKDYNYLDDLFHYGFFPDFNTSFVFSSLILKESYYNLLVQFVGLWVDTDERSTSVFSGILVSSKKICLPNSSLLILDKRFKHNLTEKELTKRYPKKSLEKGNRWKVIDDSRLSDEYEIYGVNVHNPTQILSPKFVEGIKKIRSLYPTFNILINKYGIFIAIETEYSFDIIDINLKPYEALYDACKSLKELDDILSNFEGKYFESSKMPKK